MRHHLFVPNKYDYVRGDRPKVDCILCEVVSGAETVTRLEVHRTQRWLVSLNMYPYNPGHLLILPQRHVEDLQELEVEEVQEKHALEVTCLQVLNDLYSPGGFNVGLNLGHSSGASIAHLHVHVVPRFNRELGFIDVIGGAKIMVEEPLKTQARLRKAFRKGG